MSKPKGMGSREYYHYKRLQKPKRYEPLARVCKRTTDFQKCKGIKRIIDLGSSCGPLLRELEKIYATEDTFGIDVSKYAEKHWCSKGTFIRSNLNEYDESIAETVGKVDLIVSFETAEHMTEMGDLFSLTALLSKPDSIMIFGAASPLQASSRGHVSCYWPSWWIEKFSEAGWTYDHLATTRFSYFIGEENGKGQKVPLYYLNASVFRRKNFKNNNY